MHIKLMFLWISTPEEIKKKNKMETIWEVLKEIIDKISSILGSALTIAMYLHIMTLTKLHDLECINI